MSKRTAWTQERLEQWRNTRTRGMSWFIWTHGVFQWGGFMFCFTLGVFQHSHYGSVFSTEGNLPFRLMLSLLVWTFVGYLYGQSRWRRNEQEFQAQNPVN